ncbi:sigma-70 family RNA polymerase sigma factor [Streptomyces yangpuensis]|uniref:RNA polymerase sigma factor SigS n=1 Tax=Streptomyces yangpuensis TaxID=1648182 RepID=A0ABY5Q1W4_9ACTN|nr:sigma-70 family RNA polymerase sigma factor [Streptomyces yangpuensis]UUY50162.1 sigma-70 family RNA polymerase sigma factor [Streptomyces yangpuensis]
MASVDVTTGSEARASPSGKPMRVPDQPDAREPRDRHRSWGHGFEEFYADRFKDVVIHLLRLGTSESDAHDIAQDLFISFGHKWDHVKERAYSNRAYVLASARNLRIDYYRKARNVREVPVGHDVLDQVSPPVTELGADDLYNGLQEVLRKHLSDQQCRAVLLMASGMKHSEIATVMGLSMGTVASHIAIARKKLDRVGAVALLAGS